jgi:hypothetical protein
MSFSIQIEDSPPLAAGSFNLPAKKRGPSVCIDGTFGFARHRSLPDSKAVDFLYNFLYFKI